MTKKVIYIAKNGQKFAQKWFQYGFKKWSKLYKNQPIGKSYKLDFA